MNDDLTQKLSIIGLHFIISTYGKPKSSNIDKHYGTK